METIGKSKRYSIISCLKSNGIDPESVHGKEIALKLASKEFTISKIESLKVTKKLGEIFEIPDDMWTVPSLLDNVLSNKTFD